MTDEQSVQAERLGDGIHGFQQAALNSNALIQELRGTLAAFVNGQYQLIIDSPIGPFKVRMGKV